MVEKMTEKEQIIITPTEAGTRIDRLLAERFPELTRSYIQKMIREEAVLVNEKPARASYKASEGDAIQLTLPEPEPLAIEPENIPLDILTRTQTCLWSISQKGWSSIRLQDITAVRLSMRFCITVGIHYPGSTVYCARESCIALIRIRPVL